MFAKLLKLLHDVKHTCCFRIHRMELKERLQQARKHSGKSMDQVAQDLGLSRIQVWRMEKNAEAITVKRLQELAAVYGRPIQSFFDDKVEISESEISYQIIGIAIEAVEAVASKMDERPSTEAFRAAAIAVIRAQQKRWAENPNLRFKPEEFTVFIERELNS
ncbi:helix-turn-helix domain-containing protein [Roseibium sp. MMSF_3412]|uniref:helix-turn-helix domain-containing protein n=1 Tax=Roseibium sp. MMSF_3412 TaxID=3046712 RepID=UPI00273D474C|nr:helix-turn-helix transcriptional regulator [Roseibium sp. MMSF_3412]